MVRRLHPDSDMTPPSSNLVVDAARRQHSPKRRFSLGSALAMLVVACSSASRSSSPGSDGGGMTIDGASDGPISETGVGSVGNDGALPACTWPASLDDAAPRQCSAARAYVACEFTGGGGGTDCMSNDSITCPGASGASCTDLCNAKEYAVGCGGVGPAPSPPLPAGCRGLPSGPGGGVSGCCPCGS